ncbi:MAG TPA: LuxR C-terminal-related transcriptional regulator [Actinomycetes bacterium]|jgi:LuxR family maltose regulon positive regulatory protein|nr:LuxR C-terminal-related transcriptional regulator [Actinomycetes bacterium]
MAGPPGRTPAQADAGRSDGLLATKLHVPGPPPGFVARPRLLERLEEGLARGLVLVCAPAGFGKTSLLAEWARRGGHPVAWLSLDQADNDPARFWRHVVAALDRARPGLAEQLAPLLGPPAPRSFEGLVAALVNQLAARPGDDQVVLVLDDYHLVEARPVHASLGFLLEHRPPGLALVLTSRADPPLGLARLRARGQLAELRDADLRFTQEEAAALLYGAVGPELPEAAAAVLAARTEGWVAGLQLAGLSLRGQADVAGFVATFGGSHRFVLDYLAEEVLERQPEQVRAFLLETSVLERLSGALCDAVTGRGDGQAMLELVERANLFLVPLDEVRGWWRYHQLFADLLRARLQQEQPERVPGLHRAAAAWSEASGLADDAVRHALAAGDATWAARLAERHADELLLRSEGATVQRWLAALPAELVGSRPRLLLVQARLALLSGRVEGVDDLLDAAERMSADAADEPYEPSVSGGASLLANVPATIALDRAYLAELRGDPDRAIGFASRALAEVGEDEWMLQSNASGYLAVAEWLGGRPAEAERLLSSTIAQWLRAGQRPLALRGWHHLGQVQRAQGRLDAALGTYRQALEVAAPPGRPALPGAGMAQVGLAEVAYQRGELDAALEQVTEGIGRCRQLVYTPPLAMGLATLAWIRQAMGDAAGALEAMGEAERVAPGPGVASLLNPVPAQRARLQLAHGEVAAAARWTKARGLGGDDEPSYPREPGYLVLARVLLAQDRPDQALGLLGRLLAAAVAQGRLGSVVEIQALRALALAAGGEQSGALAVLAEALALACERGYVRVFADEGAPMGTLLGRLVTTPRQREEQTAARSVPLECLARLLRAFDAKEAAPRSGRGAAVAVPGLVEQLTDRELQVLGLLAAGRSNQRIAGELVVSLDTVKKHVGRVLDKLGAANRTEAVARARELGLLS